MNAHDEAGEDDYRPYDGNPPRPPYDNLYVVRAEAVLADESRHAAMMHLSPQVGGPESAADAEIFGTDGKRVSLIPASMGLGEGVRQASLAALGRTEEQIFPVNVTAGPDHPTIAVLDWFAQRVVLP